MSKLEKALWELMDPVINLEDDLDLFQMIKYIDEEEFIHDIDHDDMVLGISGIDPDALERIKRRRELIGKLKKAEEETKKQKEEALKIMIKRRVRTHVPPCVLKTRRGVT